MKPTLFIRNRDMFFNIPTHSKNGGIDRSKEVCVIKNTRSPGIRFELPQILENL